MKSKTIRDRLDAFGAAGGTLVVSPIVQMLVGLDWSLLPLVALEFLGILFIFIAIALYIRK